MAKPTGPDLDPLDMSHAWRETFMKDRFPLICRACLQRSDQPGAQRPCVPLLQLKPTTGGESDD